MRHQAKRHVYLFLWMIWCVRFQHYFAINVELSGCLLCQEDGDVGMLLIMSIEESKLEILTEARKHGKQIWKLKSDRSQFVKVKRGYSEPEDTRLSYLSTRVAIQRNHSCRV